MLSAKGLQPMIVTIIAFRYKSKWYNDITLSEQNGLDTRPCFFSLGNTRAQCTGGKMNTILQNSTRHIFLKVYPSQKFLYILEISYTCMCHKRHFNMHSLIYEFFISFFNVFFSIWFVLTRVYIKLFILPIYSFLRGN